MRLHRSSVVPPVSRRCCRFRAGFPSRHAREKRFWRPISPKLSGRHFFGVTMFAPSRLLSASDIWMG